MNEDLTGQEPESVTILRSAQSWPGMRKRFTISASGAVTKDDYGLQKHFAVETIRVDGLRGLHSLLCHVEQDARACIVRAALLPDANPAKVLRRIRGEGAAFFEVPRSWAMLDVDGLPLPPHFSVLRDPEAVARFVLSHLAEHMPEIARAGAIVQFSSSAGLKELAADDPRWNGIGKDGLSAHVWFWLDRPMAQDELKRWVSGAKAAGLKLSDTLTPVQIHYTAAPLFGAGLYDPLADRRTLLIPGDSLSPVVPAVAVPTPRSEAGGNGTAGFGYRGALNQLGGDDGFRGPMVRAIGIYVAQNWPSPDLQRLKDDLREHIFAADPGGRDAPSISRYASDQHLDELIEWTMQRELEKRAGQETQPAIVRPTYPSRKVSLRVAEVRAKAVIAGFAERMRKGERPEMLLRMTVGGGKSQVAVEASETLLDAARDSGRDGAEYYIVPRHDLGGEMSERMAAAHPGLAVATWRGMSAADPLNEGKDMCLDPDLPNAARRAGVSASAVCKACPLRDICGYQRQCEEVAGADIVLVAHNLAFSHLPSALPKAAFVVIDEQFLSAGLVNDPKNPVQLDLGALLDTRTGSLSKDDADYLLRLRRAVFEIVSTNGEGGLFRDRFVDYRNADLGFEGGFGLQQARDWHSREWDLKPKLEFLDGTSRETMLEALADCANRVGFSKSRAILAKQIVALLTGGDVRSINAIVQPGGTAVRLEWRNDFAAWVAEVPKLFLDATTHPEVVKQWAKALTFEDIEIETPKQRVRQIVGGEFGREWVSDPRNQAQLVELIAVELTQGPGQMLVVVQKKAVEPLERLIAARLGETAARVVVAHFGALTGLNKFEEFESEIIVGRPAVNRTHGERMAELIKGGAVNRVQDGNQIRWPFVMGGIRMADGAARAVSHPQHPDPLVEAVRWSITEGNVEQANRLRGVRRSARIVLVGDLPLPLDVHEVLTWDEALPDRITATIARAALEGRAVPCEPGDFVKAFPEAGYRTAGAFKTDHKRLKRNKGGQSPIMPLNRGLTPFATGLAKYRKEGDSGRASKAVVPLMDSRAALEAEVGPLSHFEMLEAPSIAPAAPAREDAAEEAHRYHVQMGRLIWEQVENMRARSRGLPPVRLYEHASPPS